MQSTCANSVKHLGNDFNVLGLAIAVYGLEIIEQAQKVAKRNHPFVIAWQKMSEFFYFVLPQQFNRCD